MYVTSKARRRYNIRGSQAAPSGAPQGSRRKATLKKRMVVTEEGEGVFYKLPGAKKTTKEQTQSYGGREKCEGGRKETLVKSFSLLKYLHSFQNK